MNITISAEDFMALYAGTLAVSGDADPIIKALQAELAAASEALSIAAHQLKDAEQGYQAGEAMHAATRAREAAETGA